MNLLELYYTVLLRRLVLVVNIDCHVTHYYGPWHFFLRHVSVIMDYNIDIG
jgi:hypothetical protein